MASTTRGPLPPAVYWRRRLVVLTIGLMLVLAIGKVLARGSDGSSNNDRATRTGAGLTASHRPQDSRQHSSSASGTHHASPAKPHDTAPTARSESTSPTPTVAAPTGPCDDTDVLITATVPHPVAGGEVDIVLNLQTGVAEACTWQVSSKTVTMKITSGVDDVWSSHECPKVIPTQDVVVRRQVATQVTVVWNSRRSDQYCSNRTAWALPGYYHVAAAALAGEPTDVQFKLEAPVAGTVTETAKPKQHRSKSGHKH